MPDLSQFGTPAAPPQQAPQQPSGVDLSQFGTPAAPPSTTDNTDFSDDRLANAIADQITLKLVPNWKLSSPAAPEPAFIPPPDLVGKWNGTLQTYRSSTPFHLEVSPSGEVRVNLGNQLGTILDQVSFQDGTLYGMFKGDIDLPEAARRPYVLSINLKLRDGKVLNGAITARATGAGTMPAYDVSLPGEAIPQSIRVEKGAFVLAQWAELRK